MKKYSITTNFGMGNKTHIAWRNKGTFYFDHSSAIGCSTINVGNKFLISYGLLN